MRYGISDLSLIPVRKSADPESPVFTQLLYGELFKVLKPGKHFTKIRDVQDGSVGYIASDQFRELSESEYLSCMKNGDGVFTRDLLSYVTTEEHALIPVVMGSAVDHAHLLGHTHEGGITNGQRNKANLVGTALYYLNAPYYPGGKTPFGIDAPGLVQMVYRLNGIKLPRTVQEQAELGEACSFIEECEPGDLAFFADASGVIDHVGILMEENYIIHCYGRVRTDRIDHTGIFDPDKRTYSHKLRVLRKIDQKENLPRK